LREQKSAEDIRRTLNNLTYGLDYIYERALESIARQTPDNRKLARKILMWALYSGRRLHMTELLEALAVKLGEQRIDAQNRLNTPSLVTKVCAGLVLIDQWGYVELIHPSVRDYFLSQGEGTLGPLDFHVLETPSNIEISQVLLTYLMHEDLDLGDAVSLVELSDGFRAHPLALYAAAFWADHVRGLGEKVLNKLLLAMLQNPRPNSSPMRILFANSFLQNGRFDGFPKDSNPLHILVSSNLECTVRSLQKERLKKYLNKEDCDGETPLLVATRENMTSIAEYLIKAGAKIHHRSPRGLDALHRACMHGDVKIVRLLLDCGGNPNVQTREGTTIPSVINGQADEEVRLLSHAGWNACHAAAYHGRTAVVKMLIEAKVEINVMSEAGWPPIYEAISNNHPRIFEQLLMAGADINLRRQNGESVFALAIRLSRFTCLQLLLTKVSDVKMPIEGDTMINKAALAGDLEIVNYLIILGADLNAQTEDKASFPLYSAAWKGHEKIVERLISAGADVNISKTTHYATALLAAVQNNQKAIVNMLLEAGADPAIQLEGWSVLHCATQSKSLDMVEIALSTNPDVNGQGSVGRTPLQNACEEGCELAILEKLREAGADPHLKTGEHERSALYYAALNGHEHIVEWLISQGVDINSQNDNSDTALALASVNGYLPVVRLLLKAGADVNIRNKKERSPLLDAASCGHSAIAELLIKAGADINISDIYQFTALSLAAGNNRWAIVHVLLESGATVDGRGPGGWSPLMSAARSGFAEIMQILLKRGADVRLASDDGNTAAHLAAENGHVHILRILVEAGALVNAHEKGRTALFEAAKNGHVEAIRYLLSVGADPMIRIPEERYVTPIQCAATYNHPLCIKEFLKAGVPIDHADSEGCTSLHYAGRFGRTDVIELLLAEGANPTLKTKTPHGCSDSLQFACMNGHIEAVRVLTAAGFDVNGSNADGVVPLHW
jgi:ankyrin repeat protein